MVTVRAPYVWSSWSRTGAAYTHPACAHRFHTVCLEPLQHDNRCPVCRGVHEGQLEVHKRPTLVIRGGRERGEGAEDEDDDMYEQLLIHQEQLSGTHLQQRIEANMR